MAIRKSLKSDRQILQVAAINLNLETVLRVLRGLGTESIFICIPGSEYGRGKPGVCLSCPRYLPAGILCTKAFCSSLIRIRGLILTRPEQLHVKSSACIRG